MKNKKIGFIGQGYIGKNYSNDFERRGFEVIRYALEKPYNKNKLKIKDCDIVFIAVPTPTTPKGFDNSIVQNVINLVGKNKTVVIKSTLLPGTTELIQEENPDLYIFHSPEFLTELTAAENASNPDRNIVGIPIENSEYRNKAKEIIDILPKAPYELICKSSEAEFIKYGGNCWFYLKVVFINLLFDLTQKDNFDWNVIQEAMAADSRIGSTHLNPIHKRGRGAGGNCFIKDFSAFIEMYSKSVDDDLGIKFLKSVEKKNIELLLKSKKDIDLLEGVYGKIE